MNKLFHYSPVSESRTVIGNGCAFIFFEAGLIMKMILAKKQKLR